MQIHRSRLFALCATTALFLVGASSVFAADADHVRVRGTVTSFSGKQLVVKSREGTPVTLTLDDKFMISSVVKSNVGEIHNGDFVGIASLPKSEGGDGALEVLIFPPALKGLGEGSYGWDLKPNSTMTNATVADAVKSVDGSTVTVNYHGQDKKISVPNGTPVVKLGPATTADLTPGTVVFISAVKKPDGSVVAGQAVVGKNGVVPPM